MVVEYLYNSGSIGVLGSLPNFLPGVSRLTACAHQGSWLACICSGANLTGARIWGSSRKRGHRQYSAVVKIVC